VTLRGEGEQSVFAGKFSPSPRSGEAAKLERGPGGEARVAESSVASSVRSFANAGDITGAKAAALAAIKEQPLNAEAHYLLAAVLIDLRCDVEAIAVLHRALYLDSKFIVAHLALALALDRIGESEPARRALRTVRRLCAALPKTAAPPGPDGESAAYFATIAEGEEARLARVVPQRGSRPLS
jgi:chemotaxis protein methyltransferase CheR